MNKKCLAVAMVAVVTLGLGRVSAAAVYGDYEHATTDPAQAVQWAAAAWNKPDKTGSFSQVVGPGPEVNGLNVTNTQNFFQSVVYYFSSFNTNFTWNGTMFEISVAADYQQGLQWANDLDIDYDLPSTNVPIQIGYVMRNAGIAGTIEMNQIKVGWNAVTYCDTRVEISLLTGYDDQYASGVVEPRFDLRKKLTANTFAGLYISEPIFWKHLKAVGPQPWVPNIGVEAGCSL